MREDLTFAASAGSSALVALVAEDGAQVSYAELAERVARPIPLVKRALVFLFIENTLAGVTALLSLLRGGHVVALMNPDLAEDQRAALVARYRPDWIVAPERVGGDSGYVQEAVADGVVWRRSREDVSSPLHADVAVLLSTSGSTGSPKFVRLSLANLRANAEAIAQALDIRPDDRAVAHLSFHYSFGLSVLTSHLHAGASLALNTQMFTSADFWAQVRRDACTSLPGVPYHYEVLRRLDLDRLGADTIKVCTQAGGRLAPQFVKLFADKLATRGGRFYVMYGQTEAAPRMTTLPADAALLKPESVGRALPGGRLEIIDAAGSPAPAGVAGEVVYRGPNVMMGYAESRAELELGDVTGGALRTGDLGYLDADGDLFITGRAARMAKIFGLRISLDDVERQVEQRAAAIERAGKIVVAVEDADADTCAEIARGLAERLQIHPTALHVRAVEQIPVKSNGKVDYQTLAEQFA